MCETLYIKPANPFGDLKTKQELSLEFEIMVEDLLENTNYRLQDYSESGTILLELYDTEKDKDIVLGNVSKKDIDENIPCPVAYNYLLKELDKYLNGY